MIAAAILAAGAGRRIGTPKALLQVKQQSFLETILRRLKNSGINNLFVVAGHQYEQVGSVIPDDLPCQLLKNSAPENGPLSSLQIALRSMDSVISGCIMVLVDHPLVTEETYCLLIQKAEKHPDLIIIPEFEGKNGHPVYFGKHFFPELLAAPWGQGARYVVHNNRNAILNVVVDDPGVIQDIDTAKDYERFILLKKQD
jgi:CTP:molybdopterin cytidylyltransferase MocA